MKYFYEERKDSRKLPGIIYIHRANNHLFLDGTLYYEKGNGLVVVRKYFDKASKRVYYGPLPKALANDIYEREGFQDEFTKLAGPRNAGGYPFVDVRKLMWALRMKPLKKDIWEYFF